MDRPTLTVADIFRRYGEAYRHAAGRALLPSGFHRIRYYGLLGHRHRREHLARCRQLLGMIVAPPSVGETRPLDYRDRYESLTGVSLRACPVCADGHMIVTECLRPRPYPALPDTS